MRSTITSTGVWKEPKALRKGDFGWHKRAPEFCGSTLRLACKAYPHQWIEPKWETQWFPDAFVGTMANLLCAVENGTDPEIVPGIM